MLGCWLRLSLIGSSNDRVRNFTKAKTKKKKTALISLTEFAFLPTLSVLRHQQWLIRKIGQLHSRSLLSILTMLLSSNSIKLCTFIKDKVPHQYLRFAV